MMFGVFLVAITILTMSIGAILDVKNAPNWLDDWGWIALLGLCAIATIAIVVFVSVAGWAFWKSTREQYKKFGSPNARSDST